MRYRRHAVLLLVLLLVTGSSQPSTPLAGAAAAPTSGQGSAECPVTPPPEPPLSPPQEMTDFLRNGIEPAELREQAVLLAAGQFWYGNDALWLALPPDGVLWNTKQPWWRAAPLQASFPGELVPSAMRRHRSR